MADILEGFIPRENMENFELSFLLKINMKIKVILAVSGCYMS